MKKDEKGQPLILVYALIIALLLFAIAAYYVSNQDKYFRDTPLIGDAVCGNLPSESGQDACCYQAHENDVTIECVGSWRYVEGVRECQYICQGAFPNCPDDGKQCSDGRVVLRDSNNECYFKEC